jgi:PAS domain S-box-containing protein
LKGIRNEVGPKEEEKNMDKLLRLEESLNEIMAAGKQIAELKVQMKTLRASEKKFRTLVENIPQRLYLRDTNSVYIFCNDPYAADLKMEAENIVGKTDYEFFPKEWAEKHAADDKRVMGTGRPEEREEEYLVQGKSLIVRALKIPVQDETGETVGILGILTDITGQQRKEKELRRNLAALEKSASDRELEMEAVRKQLEDEIARRELAERKYQEMEERFRAFFENTGPASVMIEENLNIILANREFEKLSGYPREEVEQGKSLAEFLNPDEIGKIKEFCHSGGRRPGIVLREDGCQFNSHWGNVTDIRITAAIVPGSQKALVSLLDISDRRRAEESLQEWQKKFQTMVENSKESILVMQDGWLKFANPRFFEISGYTEEELTSRPFMEFVPSEDRGIVEDQWKKLREGESLPVYYFRMIPKEGDLRWLVNRAVSIQWEKRPALLIFLADGMDDLKGGGNPTDIKSKEHLISLFARLLKTDMNLDFLSKLESAELENLTALTRDRVDQEKK